jgi:hypothetical protein
VDFLVRGNTPNGWHWPQLATYPQSPFSGAVETSTHTGLRDRTLLGTLAYISSASAPSKPFRLPDGLDPAFVEALKIIAKQVGSL